MKAKTAFRIGTIFSALALGLFVVGCASTGTSYNQEQSYGDEVADIDELLGLTGETTETGDDTIQEDDVLRLLGVTGERESTQTQTEANPTTAQRQTTETTGTTDRVQPRSTQQTQTQTTASLNQPVDNTAPAWRSSSFQDRYQEAFQDYQAKRYRESIQKFENLLSENTSHSLSDNCQYWIGEAYYGLANFQQAILAFEKVFSFPKSNKDDAAQLKLGLSYLRMQDRERAKREFQKLIENYPTSEYVSMAKRYLAQMEQ